MQQKVISRPSREAGEPDKFQISTYFPLRTYTAGKVPSCATFPPTGAPLEEEVCCQRLPWVHVTRGHHWDPQSPNPAWVRQRMLCGLWTREFHGFHCSHQIEPTGTILQVPLVPQSQSCLQRAATIKIMQASGLGWELYGQRRLGLHLRILLNTTWPLSFCKASSLGVNKIKTNK